MLHRFKILDLFYRLHERFPVLACCANNNNNMRKFLCINTESTSFILAGVKKSKGKINPNIHRTLSLCGDLNKGYIPKNPMKQNILGSPYPL